MLHLVVLGCLLFVLGCSGRDPQGHGDDAIPTEDVSAEVQAGGISDSRAPTPRLTRAQVIQARRQFVVEVLEFDATRAYGTTMPYSDYVRLRITNNSEVTLPCLTVLTKRYDANGSLVGGSRAPQIPTRDIAPGETVEMDYYPKGHLEPFIVVVKRIDVEIEDVIDPEAEAEGFFPELAGK